MPKTEPTEPKLQTTPDDPIIIDSDCNLPPVKRPNSPAKCPVIKESQKEFSPIQVSDVHIIPYTQPLQEPPQVPPQVPLQVPAKKKVTFKIKKDDSPAEPMSPKVPSNSPVSSQPDVLLTQRLVQVKIYITFNITRKKISYL